MTRKLTMLFRTLHPSLLRPCAPLRAPLPQATRFSSAHVKRETASGQKEDDSPFFTLAGMSIGAMIGASTCAYSMGRREEGRPRDLEDSFIGAGVGCIYGVIAGGLWVITLPLAVIGLGAVGAAYAIDEIPFRVVLTDKKQ